MSNVKVAVILPTINVGGAENMVTQLVSRLNGKLNIKLFILGGKQDNQFVDQLEDYKVDATYMGLKGRFSLKNYNRFSDELLRFKPDLIHANLDSTYSLIFALLNKVKILYTFHSQIFRMKSFKIRLLFTVLFFQKKLKLIGVSDSITSEAKETFHIKDSCIKTIYNPVDVTRFNCKRDYNRSNVTFVNIARFHTIKNHKLLIESFKEVLSEFPNCKLVLVGTGELYSEMVKLTQVLEIEKSVTFLGNVEKVENVLGASDIFVLSSCSEALPISVLEAMASGLPIIATKVGGLFDIIDENGILVKPNSKIELSTAMKMLASNSNKRIEMSHNSLTKVENFNIQEIASEYERTYMELIS